MKVFFSILLLCLLHSSSFGQDNSIATDSTQLTTVKHHIPKIATQRSAILPGWGQAYNKQYWKIPLVYGVLAIPAATYQYNADLYSKAKFAYEARFKEANGDKSDVSKIDPTLKNLGLASLQSYRNIFRKDRDYSIMWFILGWGLNVLDATVSGHLKEFDINNDLSLKIQPNYQPEFRQAGLSLQLHFKNNSTK
ncbi:MAG: hypothetical protein RL377_1489 [Bacteroidota bacterium]